MVLTCLRSETRSNIYQIWSFTMHSLSLSTFFGGPGALLLHFSLSEQDIPFISMIYPWVIFWKEAIFPQMRPKSGFKMPTLRNTFQPFSLLKFHHPLIIFIKFLSAALVHFYSVLLYESKIFCSSQWFIQGGFFEKKKVIFTDETKKVVLTCLHLETRSHIYYFWSFTMHSSSSSNLILRPWCTCTPFYPKRTRYSVHLKGSSMWDFLKINNFSTDETKNVVLTCLRSETRSNIY